MKKSLFFIGVVSLAGLAGCSQQAKRQSPSPTAEVPVRPVIAAAPEGKPAVWPENAPQIYARSAILIDARTGKTLYQKNADMVGPVASTQKLLSALLVIQDGSLDKPVTIERHETLVKPTKLGIRPGETYTRRSLLSAMMVKSQNDAAAALARDVAGTEAAFAHQMNRMAYQLGAKNSNFVNSHGLPANQYSTARDIARIAFRAYREPEIRRLAATRNYTFFFNSGRRLNLENTNKLLGKFYPVNGMKTGYTVASGRCLVASAAYGGRELIFVQIRSRTADIFSDAERMFTWALGNPPMNNTLAGIDF